MAHLGHDPDLEERLFCDDCRGGAHGQVISYDHLEVNRLLEAKELALGERCVRCGAERERSQRHRPHAAERKSEAEFKEEERSSHRRG